uniref:Uncharacterized protein n=1 Tax=Salix viminalis TaxID=40686 RepID=A0A6N2MTV9_SALVM
MHSLMLHQLLFLRYHVKKNLHLLKNANGSNYDTPESARLLVLRLHSRWVVAAGGFLTHSVPLYATGVEVSPTCSYAGENLEAICRGRTFHAPCEITF